MKSTSILPLYSLFRQYFFMPNTDKRRSIYSRSKKKFEKWKRDGRGTGTGRDYKPGLKITEVPSGTENNRKHSVPGIKAKGRLVQLMSDLEFFVFIFGSCRISDCYWVEHC
ncbi:hypothetical protein [Endozoicomonas sp. SCSIO W0465]|uniref:hypothetical protein n=1 Tax=Endozoicomonas sp. SCSIO W0465 TaxID=2918516 RepID=UPI0020763AB9|nr:hypothetical protein [Endozoicomonas sp. SCSIO W0465]USE35228.1 hypothetical protein MJO57_24480 [Endozoicomonas sp. SCSIO W0465]